MDRFLWLTPERLEGNELDRFWRLVVAERHVRETLNHLITARDDKLLTLLSSESGLELADVALALQTLRPTFDRSHTRDLAALLDSAPAIASPRPTSKAKAKAKKRRSPREPAASTPELPTALPALTPPTLDAEGEQEACDRRRSGSERGLPVPPSHSRPVQVTIAGHAYATSIWKDVLVTLLEHLHAINHPRYEALFSSDAMQGRTKRHIARQAAGMREPRRIPGGFVESHMSAANLMQRVEKILHFCGVSLSDFSYTLAEP